VSGWLDPLRDALEQRTRPLDCFFRDDDGGWDDAALLRLATCFERAGAPLDIAMIPAATGTALAACLLERKRGGTTPLALTSHPCSHLNHEATGRKCEFGTSRTHVQQLGDIEAGRIRLQRLFGEAIDPIFTPPWNRCTDDTVAALGDLGFRTLSRHRGASPDARGRLHELNVHVDWMRHRAATGPDQCAIVEALVDSLRHDEPVGIMLHHAVMTDGDFHALSELLFLLGSQAHVGLRSMSELAARAGQPVPS